MSRKLISKPLKKKVSKEQDNLVNDDIMFEAGDVKPIEGVEYINVTRPYSSKGSEDYIPDAFAEMVVDEPNDTTIYVSPYPAILSSDIPEHIVLKSNDPRYNHYRDLFKLKELWKKYLKDQENQITIDGKPATYVEGLGWVKGYMAPEVEVVPARKKGGIMKGQDDLDVSNINLSSIDLPTRRDFMEMPKYQPANQGINTDNMNRELIPEAPKKKLLPRNVSKYGLLSRRRDLLNNQSETQPIISGERLFRDMTLYGNTTTKLKKGGILKGQDDLDTFDIIEESKKLPRKNPSNPVYIPKVTRNVKPEYELPEGTFQGEPGFFVGNDTIPSLQDRGFVIPVNEGEEAIKRFKDRFKKRTVATPLAYKKGGIVKGQNDLDTDTDIDSIQDPFERARLHNAREAEISRLYFNSTPSIGNLVRGAYHWWMSKPSLGGETGYVTGVAPIVGFAKGVGLAKLPTDLLSKWKALNLTSKSRELLEHYLENNSNSMGELSKAVRNLLLHPNIEKYSTIDIQPSAASSMVNGARSYKFKKLTREQRRDIMDYTPESYTRKDGKPSLFTDRKIKHTW